MAPRVDPVASDSEVPGAHRRRGDRRRHHRHLHGVLSGAQGRARGAVREGPDRRRAVEPQLGLVPQDGPRPARDPAGDRGAAAVAGDERADRGGDRLPPVRHRLSVQDAGGDGEARGVAGGGAAVSARHADAVARRGGCGAAGPDAATGRARSIRRATARRAAEGGAGDRRGGAAARRGGPAAMRGARHRDAGGARCRRGDRARAHRLRQRRAGRRRVVAAVLRQPRPAAAAAQGDVVGDAHRAIRRRTGDLVQRLRLRRAQAAGRRLQRRELERQRGGHRAGHVPLLRRLPAGAAAAVAQHAAAHRRQVPRGVAGAAALGARCGLAVRARAHAGSGAVSTDPGPGAHGHSPRRSRRSAT